MSFGVLIIIALRRLLVFQNLILVIREVKSSPITEVIANLVVPVQGQFPSPALHFSQVGVRHGEAQQPRSRSVNQQNVFTVLTVIVHRSTETVVKEIHVDTIVLFQGCFPTHIGIVLGGFSCSQTDCTVFNTKAVSVSAVTVRQTAVIHFIRVGQVKETEVQVARLVVTYQTQTGTQFQECHPRLQRLEPFFLTHNPSHRTCREGTEATFRRKVLGTVVTDVELGHVTVFPVVGHTSYQTYIPTGNVTVLRATAAKVILLGLVVQQQGRHIMVAERTGIVQAGLHVPVTRLAGAVRITYIRILACLTVSQTSVFLQHGSISGYGTTRTGLCHYETTVVRTFQLDRKSLRNEIQFLVEHQVGRQFVIADPIKTGTIVCHTITSGKRKSFVTVIGSCGNKLSVYNTRTGERSGIVHVLNHTGCSLAGMRLAVIIYITCHVERQKCRLGDVNIKVRTIVETLVRITYIIRQIETVEQTVLRISSGRNEITHLVRTARHTHVMLALQRRAFHDVIGPTGIRETYRVGMGTEFLHNRRRENLVLSVILHQLVIESGILIRIGLFHHLCRLKDTGRSRERNFRLSFLTALGSNQDNTIRTTDTKHRRSGSVLQHGHALDFVRVNVRHASFHSVHLNQRRRITESSFTTHQNVGRIRTRLTGILHRGQTGHLTTQHISDRTYRRTHQFFRTDTGDSSSHTYLFLHTVSYHLHFAQHGRIVGQCYFHVSFCRNGYRIITDERDSQFLSRFGINHKHSINICNSTDCGTFNDDIRTDNGFTIAVDDRSLDIALLLSGFYRSVCLFS